MGHSLEAIGRQSVRLDLHHGEFGDVRIRVALSQQTVHTHLVTQRAEMGEALLNRQDQLQSALQSSGLELGAFRVHIDRQGSSHTGYDRTTGYHQPVSFEQRDDRTATHEQEVVRPWPHELGRLNLFA
jgi:hypothetical protein